MPGKISSQRRGISTLWAIAAAPALLTLLGVITDVANLLLARVELESALEAAALAGVREWSDGGGGSPSAARVVAQEYAAGNTVLGYSVVLDSNEDLGNPPNENLACEGDLVFGAITNGSSPYDFDAAEPPSGVPNDEYAVRAQDTLIVNSFWNNLMGIPVGPYNVTVSVFARVDSASGDPQLIRVGNISCP